MSFTAQTRFSKIHYYEDRPDAFAGIHFAAYEKCFQRAHIPLLFAVPVYSLRVDLKQSAETILASCRQNTRNEIRRGGRSGLIVSYNKNVDLLCLLHEKMAEEKGMDKTIAISRYQTLKNYLFCSFVYQGERLLAGHSYLRIPEKSLVMLKTSASVFRGLSHDEQKLTGIANRYLHYQDMLHFKEEGYDWYDFGGYAEGIPETDPKYTINKFKEGFGGEKVQYWNYKSLGYILLEAVFRLRKTLSGYDT